MMALSAGGGVTAFCTQYIIVISPHLRDLLDLEPEALGFMLSAPLVTGIIGTLAGGWLADRTLTKPAALVGIGLVGGGYALCALPPTYAFYVAGSMIIGLGITGFSTVVNVVITRAYPGSARRFLTWYQISVAGSSMIGPTIWEALFSWTRTTPLGLPGAIQILFAVAMAGCLISGLPLLREKLPEAPPPEEGKKNGTPPLRIGLPLVIVCVFVALHTAADNGMYFWVPDYVTRAFDPLAFPPAWIMTGFAGAYFVGRLILAHLPERWNDLLIIVLASGLGGVFSFLAFSSGNQHMLAGFYATAGLCMSADYPSILSHVGKLFPRSTGRVMALTGAVGSGASFALPPIMGYVGKVTGSMMIGMLIPSTMLVTLSVTATIWWSRCRRTGVG